MTRIERINTDKKESFYKLTTDKTELLHKATTDKIIRAYYNVYNELGFGFLEKVYENSLLIELNRYGLLCERQKPIKVFYHEKPVGEYFADIVVDKIIILELKAAQALIEEHELQLINYLKATKMEVGLLLNFGREPEFKRKLFTNDKKIIAHR